MTMRLLLSTILFFAWLTSLGQNNSTATFMWDERTSVPVLQDAISRGISGYRSRDITILQTQPLWNVFASHGANVDVMVAIPVYYTYTTTPVDIPTLMAVVNNNPFIRRLQVYPKLQPGLMNPSELNPCNDWLTGYTNEFEQRIRQIDQLVTDKSVEIVIAGQLGTPGCASLTQIVNTLYDLQSTGRNVAWAVTVYPYFYNQDPSLSTLAGDIDGVVNNLAALAPPGKSTLPLRVIETGWPSEAQNDCPYYTKATPVNHCTFTNSVFAYSRPNVKLYYFELQDNIDGWTSCEKHFGLYDASGNIKCQIALDVSLKSFKVSKQGENAARLHWSAEQRGIVKFQVEKSFDGVLFSTMGEVVVSNSSTTHEAIDPDVDGATVYYRLKMQDEDNLIQYSPIVSMNQQTQLQFHQPVIRTNLLHAQEVSYSVVNACGSVVMEGSYTATAGVAEQVLEVDNLNPGMYVVKISTTGDFLVAKFISGN